MAWKRTDWNALIRLVNALIDNGCASGTKLQEVNPGHIWTVGDITAVRNTLTAMCANKPTFSVALKTWKQDIIDELNAAIADCVCCQWSGVYTIPVDIYAVESTHAIRQNVIGSGGCQYDSETWSIWYYAKMGGIQFGPVGYVGREFVVAVSGTSHSQLLGSPPIDTPWNSTQFGSLDKNGIYGPSDLAVTFASDNWIHTTRTPANCASSSSYHTYALTATMTVGSGDELKALGYLVSPGKVKCV